MSEDQKQIMTAVGGTVVLLAVGIGTLWLTKKVLGIEGDAVFIALILVPALVYLVLAGKLKELTLPGGTSLAFQKTVEAIKENVDLISGDEPQKSTYLGKLRQVIEKDKKNFCLIYADVDDLRPISGRMYKEEMEKAYSMASEGNRRKSNLQSALSVVRTTEREINRSIVRQLVLALTDASYDANIENPKYDLFILEEPDVAMIARFVSRDQAKQICKNGQRMFSDRCGISATIAVLSPAEIDGELNARDLSDRAARRLNNGKLMGKGMVYDSG